MKWRGGRRDGEADGVMKCEAVVVGGGVVAATRDPFSSPR